MKRFTQLCIIIFCAVFLLGAAALGQAPPPPPGEVIIEGIVFDANTGKGITSLTVQLIPPRSMKSPRRVLQTDRDGNFRFKDRDPQKYLGKNLLEVRDGPKLLFRMVIDTSDDEFRRVRIPVNLDH